MRSKRQILQRITSYAPPEGREFSISDVYKAMDEFALEFVNYLIEREYVKRYRDYDENNERPAIENHLKKYKSEFCK